eukprot:6513381-Pyramimonas_sp.AAC.1
MMTSVSSPLACTRTRSARPIERARAGMHVLRAERPPRLGAARVHGIIARVVMDCKAMVVN